ncbi:uncharacterized protein LOC119401979 [Rhipicephalus sanguineus]|uniref:uncharacterized protein LOC119401979 n=1 Tax=Rhipicephalus sanguineus TaxID=34632 RepID=UPI001894792F|nr:uncharacterized protein LOC119401979 [Rhipicephalus sanguineus]
MDLSGVGMDVTRLEEMYTASPKVDKGSTLAGFAKILAAANDTVFHSTDNVIDIFEKADQTFCDDATCLTDPCTFASTYKCWAVNRQQDWNDLFNPRGAEVLQWKRGLLCFRTMEVDPESLDSLGDVKYLCLYLWFLRQHSCISAVYLSLPVLAPRHVSLFTSLLKLTDGVQKCEIRGNDPFMGPSLPMAEFRLSMLGSLSELRELGLAAVHLTDDDAKILERLVERNESLVALVLIDVEMSAVAFADVVGKVVQHKELQDFRVKMNAREPETFFDEVLLMIGFSRSISRLHVHVNRGLVYLLKGLVVCSSLSELIVENMIEDAQALGALADFLEKQPCRCLKACIDAKKLERVDGALDNMQRIVGNSSLEVLVLSGSVLSPQSARRLADGLAASKTLKQLHLDECGLGCADVLPFVKATKERAKQGKFEELNVGAITGSGNQLCDMFKTMTDADVCHMITLTYSDFLLPALRESLDNNSRFTKVTISCGDTGEEAKQAEPALQVLRFTAQTLKSLCIDSPRQLSKLGGHYVAYLIRNCKSLTVLQLRFLTKAMAARQILKAIAQSRSLVVLALERWCYKDKVHTDIIHHDLVNMLRQNESLHRLEFYLRDIEEYDNLKPHLVQGVSVHEYLTSLKIYIGEQREELVVRDPVILEQLRRNAIVQDWTMDIMLRDSLAPEAAAAVEALDAYESRLDLLRRTGAFSPRAAENRLRLARMATRTKYYLLLAAYRKHKEFRWSPDDLRSYHELMSYVRDQAFSIMGIPQERSPPSSDSELSAR